METFSAVYTAGLFFNGILPKGPTMSLGWSLTNERFERKRPTMECPAYIGLAESADFPGKFLLGGELVDSARSQDGSHTVTLPAIGPCTAMPPPSQL